MTATRHIPAKAWSRKPQAKHFKIRDEAKAKSAEKQWLAKSKPKPASK